jgi:periplasmic protein TonB
MKRIARNYHSVLIFFLLLLQVSCDPSKTNSDSTFVGGMTEMQRFIQENIRYPQEAIEQNIQGRVKVKFVVEKDGTVSYAEIVKSVDHRLDKEALRVVRSMPKWEPAYSKGKPVRSVNHLPINFTLE